MASKSRQPIANFSQPIFQSHESTASISQHLIAIGKAEYRLLVKGQKLYAKKRELSTFWVPEAMITPEKAMGVEYLTKLDKNVNNALSNTLFRL